MTVRGLATGKRRGQPQATAAHEGGTLRCAVAPWDTSRYLSLFVGEATEHLDALSRGLVQLEQSGPTGELVDALFRHAHSMKGMAASMGFEAAATLAHRLEDLLDAVRLAPARLDKDVIDLVLQAVDALQAQVKAAATGAPPPDAQPLVLALAAMLAKMGEPKLPTPPPLPSAPPPRASGPTSPLADVSLPPRFALTLRVSPASNQPGVRGFLATKRLGTLGNLFNLTPPLEDIKAGRMPQGLITVELETDESEETVRKTVAAVADVELESLRAVVARAGPPEPRPVEPEGPRVIGQEPTRTVRVRTELLDDFLDAAGELLLATARVREVGRQVPDALRPPLEEAVDRLHGLVRALHDKVMEARMTPVAVITDRLPRAARDIARRRGRDVEVTVTGGDIELDRAIVDELNDAVLHLLRNAIDHGIEPPEERRMRGKPARGTVKVEVRRLRDRVVLEFKDDGRGLDTERLEALAVERGLLTPDQARALSEREALHLCTLPGLSTAATVTDISGRGVGLDAVKRAVEAVGGALDIESTRGQGATFRLSLPLTVAMVNLLLVGVGEDVYGLPITKVSGVVNAPKEKLTSSQNVPVLHFGQAVVPVYELSEVLEVPRASVEATTTPLVVVEADDGPVALGVDRLWGQEEVVLKGLSRPLDLVPGLAGVTILGNGRPVFILDVARLELPAVRARGAP
jgi:two-component system chemotaxis sensor kinase CheA